MLFLRHMSMDWSGDIGIEIKSDNCCNGIHDKSPHQVMTTFKWYKFQIFAIILALFVATLNYCVGCLIAPCTHTGAHIRACQPVGGGHGGTLRIAIPRDATRVGNARGVLLIFSPKLCCSVSPNVSDIEEYILNPQPNPGDGGKTVESTFLRWVGRPSRAWRA